VGVVSGVFLIAKGQAHSGVTDLAIIRKEAFRNFDLGTRTDKSGRLRRIGQCLVFLVAAILNEKLKDRAKFHRLLVQNPLNANEVREVVFVSTNYDILIDNALTDQHGVVDLDSGIDLRNIEEWDPHSGGVKFAFISRMDL
jgi:hypothetical protein